mmetsp:Transcript_4466/g.14649  ORF Transcript_4466/g.14649 Transcript_4466/m.14649 type:complete len:121 (+) Transcript_4466:109-471(+)|eukprot:scaffold8290_cov136-Isochrysis_galbana.AAC.3
MADRLHRVVTFSSATDGPMRTDVLICSENRMPSVVERQCEFDSDRSSTPAGSRTAVMDASGHHSIAFVVVLAFVCLLSGAAAGGVSGFFIGKAQAELARCGAGTVLAAPRDECIADELSA